ncbi:hypothetical protein, partial [Emticicia soli]|uniref:hypothetical protein n=1 Tax=Emticicia soli TaxID=2027878 RepID=UPI0030EB1B70
SCYVTLSNSLIFGTAKVRAFCQNYQTISKLFCFFCFPTYISQNRQRQLIDFQGINKSFINIFFQIKSLIRDIISSKADRYRTRMTKEFAVFLKGLGR